VLLASGRVPFVICHVRSSLNSCGGVAAIGGFALGFVINQFPVRSAASLLSGEETRQSFQGAARPQENDGHRRATEKACRVVEAGPISLTVIAVAGVPWL
jgi:hypothetical protein